MLQKTVFVKSEKKILSKQLFYNIDALNVAINQGCKVSAKLLEYGVNQELEEIAILSLVHTLLFGSKGITIFLERGNIPKN